MNRETLQKLASRWRQAVFVRDLSVVNGIGCLAAAAMLIFLRPALAWWGMGVMAVALVARLWVSRPWRIDERRIAAHLDRTYPEVEESAALFLKSPETLTLLERLQRDRVSAALDLPANSRRPRLGDFGMPPKRFFVDGYFLAAGWIILMAAVLWLRWHTAPPLVKQLAQAIVALPSPTPKRLDAAWPRITEGHLLITPPAYTAHPPRTSEGLSGEVEEGATVTWTLSLDRPVRSARLIFGEGTAGALALNVSPNGTGAQLTGARRITEPGLYHLGVTLPDGRTWDAPDLFALKVIKDRPPVVRIVQPDASRTEVAPAVPPAAAPHVNVEVVASDDYGLGDVHMIATVAKGSGEAVKFREIPLAFGTDTALPDGVGRRLTRTLDLGALAMEPGDELYFFVQAADNRQPTANLTRSETRFITLQGAHAKIAASANTVSGVNLVPQYFRSERQIIIDTEKLIADRPTLADKEFRARANSLGIDQQLLRLRYGQLLGEELEGGNADHAEVTLDPLQRTAPEQPVGPRAAASVMQRFLQEHEEQDREGGTDEERESGARPEHPDQPLAPGEIVAPFVDQHDSQDKSTYFDGGAKGTMRDALAAMWEAEKFLRTARPEEGLAPERRALEILKDLQQSARAYVQHVGFEPAPLKVAERRLKGDASDVPARGSVTDALPAADPVQQAARQALACLPLAANVSLEEETLTALRRVEPGLTAAATKSPEVFLPGLQALRKLIAEDGHAMLDPDGYLTVRRALLRLLPAANPLPERATEADPTLGKAYFGALQTLASPR